MTGLEVIGVLAGSLAGFGVLEGLLYQRSLKKIKTRIHVAGTRGKSSTTRLIASALNEANIMTIAKTTGTLARMIMPDQREVAVYRPVGANIIEQMRIVVSARAMEADALVTECMALQPILHWISEKQLIKATHGVITNARADHLDVMGPTEADVARALAGMIPVGGTLFTGERKHLHILENAAQDRKTKLIPVTQEDVQQISDDDMTGFKYIEHRENIALALRVLEELGVDKKTALRGMRKTNPDPGALSEYTLDFFGRKIVFVNGLAANDPESTEMIYNSALERHPDIDRVIGLFNLRADRPSRTVLLAKNTTFWRQANKIVLMGTGAYLFIRTAISMGIDPGMFVQAEGERIEDIFEKIIEACGNSTLVIGMGNIGGQGLHLVRYFSNRSRLENHL
jgi:poly-gamma-glutamate synthase PgsB/CapB